MLNIPDTVKSLFQADGIRKNFRVHFPNGELSDLTNDDIVQESVKFTESLCSQDVFKFGLTEASVIEFETVGVSNLYGMMIECGIEIDLSSLTASELSDIAAGSWDGTYVDADESDLGFAFFRVPYGTFRVESCPRDHQVMTHRKVTAYTPSAYELYMNPIEEGKLKIFYAGNKYQPNLYLLMLSFLGWRDNSIILEEGFAEGAAISTASANPNTGNNYKKDVSLTLAKTGGGTITITCSLYYFKGYNTTVSLISQYTLKMDNLYTLEKNYLTDANIQALLQEAAAELEDLGTIDLAASGYSSWVDLAKAFCSDENGNLTLYPAIEYVAYYRSGTNTYTPITTSCYFIKDNKAIYPQADRSTRGSGKMPYVGGTGLENNVLATFTLPYRLQIMQGSTQVYNYSWSADKPVVKMYERDEAIPTYQLLFESTLQKVISPSTLYAFVNSYSAEDLLNGWLELRAKFGKATRTGGTAVEGISTGDPISVPPGQYIGFWWDEYDIDDIGSVRYTFTNENKEQCEGSYQFGTGSSIYDMSRNAALDAIENCDEQLINSILTGSFVPNLAPITFTPIDMKMKGLPYLEAGDYLAVAAEDGTIINSFIMRMEISGVQILTASIESESGQIIGDQGGV